MTERAMLPPDPTPGDRRKHGFFIAVLLLLPWIAVAAPVDQSAARQQSQFLIEQAYLRYPSIPSGFLEAQAWVATRWQHRLPDAASRSDDRMPPVYGLFGLYGTDDGYFVDTLGLVAAHAGLDRDALLADEAVYVDAVAAFVADEIRRRGLEGQSLEAMRPVAEVLSGIEPATDATRYAIASHVYELYRTAGTGIDLGVVAVPARAVNLTQVFDPVELERLGARQLVFDGEGNAVDEAAPKKKSAVFSAAGSGGATDQVNVDYPGALWEEAYGFSSRDGAAITHIVIHTMQGSYAGSIAWFLDPASQVSSHYLMRSSDGQITQMVRNVDKAWHARSANAWTIGIEHEGFVDNPDWYTDVMYEASAKLVAYHCNMVGIDCTKTYDGPSSDTIDVLSDEYTVKGHQHYPDQTHTDPGINWDWPRYHALVNGGVIPPAVNHLPEADFTWECTGLACTFDATASTDADGAVTAWTWDFGDGSGATGMTASHSFAAGGDYIVQLGVTDDVGAIHETRRSVRATEVTTTPPPQGSGGGGALGPWLLLVMVLLAGCARSDAPQRLEMPDLQASDYYWIAARIFENETGGKLRYLTHWNAGEDFPSLGIGHFIWFPAGVDAPFDESFPTMLEYVRDHADECAPVPDWLTGDEVPDAPWPDKASFDAAYDNERVTALREWLARTAPEQSRYIVASFAARWNALDIDNKAELTGLLQRLLGTPRGLFAVIDYYNFKGLGSNPRERYAGEGWGLAQVLGDIAGDAAVDDATLVELFGNAAAARLALRVANSPPERNEAGWLPGWRERVAAYSEGSSRPPAAEASAFRVTPYIARLSASSATITWYSHGAAPGSLVLPDGTTLTGEPRRACELAYHLAEFRNLEGAGPVPWQQTVTLDGLEPGETYALAVRQGDDVAQLTVRTPRADTARFAVYGDIETEPESTGAHVLWPAADAPDRRYPVDQTTGYAANLAAIAAQQPDFIAIAGDLVESGGEQRDWDEFWRHNASVAASIPLVPALGNHDYYGGPGDLGGYGPEGTARALARYRSFFGRDRYYRFDWGPIALLVLDANNGRPERSSMDTNWRMDDTAPDWQPGSPQYEWLENALAEAQREKAFTFIMFHVAPYSSGVHGRQPGLGEAQNFASGLPLRALTPLFLEYGVDAVFNGHDEMYEHSVVDGTEDRPDGAATAHAVHFFTVGIAGDGLRGPDPLARNPERVFLADADAPERWSDEGVLLAGGRHYGYLDVRVMREPGGGWLARLEPVYQFPVMSADGVLERFETRHYDDTVVLEAPRVD